MVLLGFSVFHMIKNTLKVHFFPADTFIPIDAKVLTLLN